MFNVHAELSMSNVHDELFMFMFNVHVDIHVHVHYACSYSVHELRMNVKTLSYIP